MRILIVTPAPPRSRQGNRVTAVRWSRFLKRLGHRVEIAEQFENQNCDLLIALHARRSARAIANFASRSPDKPLIVALTGTDLYDDIRHNKSAQRSLELADRLVLLQSHGIGELKKSLRDKARVIYQSVPKAKASPLPLKDVFEVVVTGHLRPVKDPFRAAMASRRLPASSRIRIVHLGAALSESMRKRAEGEMTANPRYRWLGELPRWKAKQMLGRSRLVVLSSKLEGGANVISEAVVAGIPILSTQISGSIGLLGTDYPGYFPVGDTNRLAELLARAEQDEWFLALLKTACRRVEKLFEPERERESWRNLLAEFDG